MVQEISRDTTQVADFGNLLSAASHQCMDTIDIFNYFRWAKRVPDHDNGVHDLEIVDDTGTLVEDDIVYLDKTKVISGTLVLYADTTALTESTHYTIDLDIGKIVITSAGATALSGKSLKAEYKYNDVMEDSIVADIIERACSEVKNEVKGKYGQVTTILDEEYSGRGMYDVNYPLQNKPLYLKQTELQSAIDSSTPLLSVKDADGFIVGDILCIEQEILIVASIDSAVSMTVLRGQKGTTAASHAADTALVNMVVKISTTTRGSVPSFEVKEFKKEWDVSDAGIVQLHDSSAIDDDVVYEMAPESTVFDRVRITYNYGTASVPDALKECVLLTVALNMMNSALAKTLPEGIDGFSPTAQQEMEKKRQMILAQYRHLYADGI